MAITIQTVRAVLAASKSSEVEFLDWITNRNGDCVVARDCADNYRTAVSRLLEDDLAGARESLLDAMSLEGEHIHYTHARAALAAAEEAAR